MAMMIGFAKMGELRRRRNRREPYQRRARPLDNFAHIPRSTPMMHRDGGRQCDVCLGSFATDCTDAARSMTSAATAGFDYKSIEIFPDELAEWKTLSGKTILRVQPRRNHPMRGAFRNFVGNGIAFAASRSGSVLPLVALLAIPIFAGIGAAIDYSRATTARTQLQTALDSALLAGAKDGSADWSTVALNLFSGNPNTFGAVVGTPSFSVDQNGNFRGSVSGSVGTSVMSALGVSSIAISATSAVAPGSGTENSCILTLDNAQGLSDLSLTLNGAPNLSLTGCGIRSNTSMNCNGHNGNASQAIAAGNVSNCSNPDSNAVAVPDIYAKLNTNITFRCAKGATQGVTWDASATSPPSGLIKVTQSYGTEYHVCGDLTLTGTGYLTGTSPSADTIIVVENGNLNVAANANVNTVRTTIILTGDNSVPSAITFPNGKGQGATLSVSPSTNSANPWQGIAIYQDPVLTNTDSPWGVADTFGPGATFNADGVVYLPRSNVTWHGSGASNNNQCTKFVFNTFTTDGSVNLNFSQSSGCTTLGVQQWVSVPLHLAQ